MGIKKIFENVYSFAISMGNSLVSKSLLVLQITNLGFSPGSSSFDRFAVGPTELIKRGGSRGSLSAKRLRSPSDKLTSSASVDLLLTDPRLKSSSTRLLLSSNNPTDWFTPSNLPSPPVCYTFR